MNRCTVCGSHNLDVAAKDATHREPTSPMNDPYSTGHMPGPFPVVAGEIVKRADGKILKPEGWKPPDIEGELRAQGWEP
jgi:hypothetical protein